MLIIRPHIFKNIPEIIFGFSTRIGLNRTAPYYFNMSRNVGDSKELVDENRKAFFKQIGLNGGSVCTQTQVHGDKITYVVAGGNCGESDALITTEVNLGLAISSADCPAIFIYDRGKKIIAAVHSGWRSTEKRILEKTLIKLRDEFGAKPEDLICYVSPSVSQGNYEVGIEVANKFSSEFVKEENKKYFLDLRSPNYKMLLESGVKRSNIQLSKLCTTAYSILHSYRRDGENSGRAIGVIAMKGSI